MALNIFTSERVSGFGQYAPGTAHYLMQTLNAVLPFDPAAVVTYAAAVCRASAKLAYHYDSMAVDEMTKLVELPGS